MREPFADPAAEAAVVALVHLGGDLSATEVEPRDFEDRRYGAIWEAALALEASGRAVDLVTLQGWLARRHPGLLGAEDIAASADGMLVMRAGNATEYTRRVIALSRRRALREALRDALVDSEDDPDIAGGKILGRVKTALSERGGPLGVCAKEGVFSAIRALADRHGDSYGLPTGMPTLDETLGGLGPGELAVLSGITGTGKTALALQISDWIANHNTRPAPVLYFSGEMLAHDLWQRILCRRARCSLADLRRGVTEGDMGAIIRQGEASVRSRLVVADAGMELTSIEAKIRRFASETPGGLVVIDHLDHVETDAESQVQVIAKVMRRIKATALSCRLPVIVVAQFNRGYDGVREPRIYDLKGGSSIEQYADSIWLLHFPYPNAPRALKLIIAKNRRGARGECLMEFEARYTHFTERDK